MDRLSLGMVAPGGPPVVVEAWSSEPQSGYAARVIDFRFYGMEGAIADAMSRECFSGFPLLGLRFSSEGAVLGTWTAESGFKRV